MPEEAVDMVLYFSGTGNSRYAARRIAAVTGDELLSINERLRQEDRSPVRAQDRLVFVVPTYAWRIPRVVEAWIRETGFEGTNRVWFVMTCGEEIGDAAKYIRRLCAEKGFIYMGTAQIVMPENYIAMYEAPGPEEASEILRSAEPEIDRAAQRIRDGEAFPPPRDSWTDRVKSTAVNPVFYRLFVKADAFAADDRCIGCSDCADLCPLNNIRMEEERPVWGQNCTHCMACITCCPTEAIEYGKKSIGKHRYSCPEGREAGQNT